VAVAATKCLTESTDVYAATPLWQQLRSALDAKLAGRTPCSLEISVECGLVTLMSGNSTCNKNNERRNGSLASAEAGFSPLGSIVLYWMVSSGAGPLSLQHRVLLSCRRTYAACMLCLMLGWH
jgi:hypothetical protein